MTFSQKVLERRRQRRYRRWSIVGRTALLISIVSAMAATTHYDHQRMLKIDAPTWSDFRVQPSLYQAVLGSVDGVPTQLTINGERWSLVKVDHFKGAEGHKIGELFASKSGSTYCQKKTIAYIAHQDSATLKIMLMHEVFHAGACLHGGDTFWNSENPTADDHPGVYHLGEFTTTFLHDNPKFAQWIAE